MLYVRPSPRPNLISCVDERRAPDGLYEVDPASLLKQLQLVGRAP